MLGDGAEAWCPRCALGEALDTRVEDGALFAVPGHVVLAELGRGAAGIVYRARQEQPAREVALKILRPHEAGSAESLARFRLEAATIAALDHPAILPVLSVGEHDGLPYFTMKLCQGTLAQRLENYRGRWRETADLVAVLAEAVQHAHARGVLHRDLKPGNVLFDEAGRPFVSDFGLAKLTESTGAASPATRPLLVMGTPGYLAPEVLAGGAGAATTAADVFALGAILHELLTGSPPPANTAAETPRPGVPRDLAVICVTALATESDRRYASAAALVADLRAWLAGRPIAARPVSATERAWSWARRNPTLAGVTLTLAATLLSTTVIVALKNRALDIALREAEAARRQAELNLAEALVAEAKMVRLSGRMGQRYHALELLGRAAKISPGYAVRSEAAAALARPDLRVETVFSPHLFNNEFDELDFSPDLQEWASGTKEGGLALRRASDGAVVRVLAAQSEGLPWFVRFGGDGRHVLASFNDEKLHVWNRETGALLFTAEGSEAQQPRSAFHPREGRLAWMDPAGGLRLRELATGDERVLGRIERNVRRLSFSPDGKWLALVTDQGVQVWDVAEAKLRWQWEGALSRTEPAWSDRGDCLAVSQIHPQQEIVVLDLERGQPRKRLPADAAIVGRLAFFPGGQLLASMETIGELTLWDWEQGERLVKAHTGRSLLRISPDGRRLAVAVSFLELGIMSLAEDAVIRPWRRNRASTYVTHALAFDGAGRRAATVDREGVRLWDVAQAAEIAEFKFPEVQDVGRDMSLLFEPAGQVLLLGQSDGVVHKLIGLGDPAPALRPVSAEGGYQLRRWVGRDLFVNSTGARRVEIWPDGDPGRARAATGRAEEGVVWDMPIISPDGRWVATPPKAPGEVVIWDARTARPVARVPAPLRVGGDFSPDGRWLVLGSAQNYTLYDTAGWRPKVLGEVKLMDEYKGWAQFSADGRWLALVTVSQTIELRDTAKFEPYIQLELSRGPGREEQAWSADGTRLGIASHGQMIYEWNLPALEKELGALGLGAGPGK